VITIGIDIGLTGAVAAVDSRGAHQLSDLPLHGDGHDKRIDGRALLWLLRQMIPPGEAGLVLIEDVRPRPMGNAGRHGNTMHSQGSLMRSRGIVEAAIDIARLQLKAVQPQTWKRFYGLIGKDKDEALQRARVLYPAAVTDLKRKKDHNRADALLVAHYGQKVLT
jgi:hypothetical protein